MRSYETVRRENMGNMKGVYSKWPSQGGQATTHYLAGVTKRSKIVDSTAATLIYTKAMFLDRYGEGRRGQLKFRRACNGEYPHMHKTGDGKKLRIHVKQPQAISHSDRLQAEERVQQRPRHVPEDTAFDAIHGVGPTLPSNSLQSMGIDPEDFSDGTLRADEFEDEDDGSRSRIGTEEGEENSESEFQSQPDELEDEGDDSGSRMETDEGEDN